MDGMIVWSSVSAYMWKKKRISLNKKEDNFLILFIGFCSKDSQEQNNDTQ